MIVTDTNLIGYLFLTNQRSEQVEQVFLKDSAWAAPLLWRSELRNVLAMYLHRRTLSLYDACQIMDEARHLLAGREYEVNSIQVLTLAANSACSAYDCEFVALAKDLQVPLVTVDRQILQHFPEIAKTPEQFLQTFSQPE